MFTAELLTHAEQCGRKGHWSRDWEGKRVHPTKALYMAIHRSLIETERPDFSELAGETVMEIASERGIDTRLSNVYDSALHHAVLADILSAHLRKPGEAAWEIPLPVQFGECSTWNSACFLEPSGARLRRIILVDHWSEDRKFSELHSWYTLGEMSVYGLPMTQIIMCLGNHRNGKRHSPWSKALQHPRNKALRFQRRASARIPGFNEQWMPVWREDAGHVSREEWLATMAADDVLRDICFPVDIDAPSAGWRKRIMGMIERKLEKLSKPKKLPGAQLSSCDFPFPCPYQKCCYDLSQPQPGEDNGFIRVSL